jgi:hypothetical protein
MASPQSPHIPDVSSLPEHLMEADPGNWGFWRTICLRGSGFPFQLLATLARVECGLAADKVLLTQAETEAQKSEYECALRKELEGAATAEERKWLKGALKRLNQLKLPDPPHTPTHELMGQKLAEIISRQESAQKQFRNEFAAGAVRTHEAIKSIVLMPRFRVAALMQNGRALSRVATALLRQSTTPSNRTFKERQNEEFVASYLQRYCAKNDTIGFFGPVGWARFDPHACGVNVWPGKHLISKSTIYFENWCIEALAEKLAINTAFLPWATPRMAPHVWLEGDHIFLPAGVSYAMSRHESRVLRKCTGEKTAHEIAREIMACGLRDCTAQTVFRLLHDFVQRKLISWTFEIPLDVQPERWLRQLLLRIDDPFLRDAALGDLYQLEQAREEIQQSLHDPDLLEKTLENANQTFTRLTGKQATRFAGKMYAGRTLVYQDCCRDLDMTIGGDVAALLADPLSIILDGARWLTQEAALVFRGIFKDAFRKLAAKTGHDTVELLQFWAATSSAIMDPEAKLLGPVIEEFQHRWRRVLGDLPLGQRCVQLTSREIRSQVELFFAASQPGWRLASYHSPDVMIAAPSAEAISRGEYLLVLGEVHASTNTLRYAFNLAQHARPQELVDAISSDFQQPRAGFVPPRYWPKLTNRTNVVLYSEHDYHIETSRTGFSNRSRERVLPIAAFVVYSCGDEDLMVRTRDSALEFEAVDFFGELISTILVHRMEIFQRRMRMPRVLLDRLVICRESWSFDAAELRFIHEKSPDDRYLLARRWMRQHDLPRYVFARAPVEIKPIYVDFDSPLYVEILIKMIRRLLASDQAREPVTLTEMLPNPDQLWLPDVEGFRYTSELRFVAKDLRMREGGRQDRRAAAD